ncbi:hypothetical protein AVEN_166813-1 [Araneus ventricosus]|uniref:BTB domain-containing protein n=1 Tax=Araneus ventricosus TaxID=182803 RepID=A0A4Y2BPB4_ARAVE|nr:hypothetical protein AVEN_166813-1 [Araneus ventricosus]
MVTEGIVADDWRCPKLSRVVHNVNTARKCDKFTDVTFVVGPDGDACTIKAHRVVLGTANDELAKLVSGFENSVRIRIPDVSPKGFKNLIRFLYDIDVKFSDLSRVRETHLVAEKFKVYKLKLATENYLNQAVKYEPILEMLQIAIEFNMPKLQLKCIDIISTKYQDVLKSEEIISAPFEVVAAVLSVRPCHGEDCQYQALLAIGKWKKKHETDRTNFAYLLNCVDFTRVRMEDFNVFIDENEELLSNVDIRAFRKCILSKEIGDAPEWYQSSENVLDEKDYNTNTEEAAEKDNLERNFTQHMELQKSKVVKALDEEMRYIDKFMTEIADKALDLHKSSVNETVRAILDYFSDLIKEAVETAVESFEDDLNYQVRTEGEKTEKKFADGEKIY